MSPTSVPCRTSSGRSAGAFFTLPPLSREICIEILRATHSATGRVAADALRAQLPAGGALAALPLPVIEGAFCEATTLAVADALADAAARMRQPAGITLADVVLNADVQEPIDRLVADVRAWKSGQLGWDEVSASILLFGPPGNGKTLLASAIAGSIGGSLVATSYSDCQKHGHQGDMLRALSEKVEAAIRSVPSVFFLDELDSFTHRNASHRRSDYIVGVVNGLLEHLSRLNDTPGVVVLGATNFSGHDRPGRHPARPLRPETRDGQSRPHGPCPGFYAWPSGTMRMASTSRRSPTNCWAFRARRSRRLSGTRADWHGPRVTPCSSATCTPPPVASRRRPTRISCGARQSMRPATW
ncbi:ATP-binding protein [Jhaorihella thermophila]